MRLGWAIAVLFCCPYLKSAAAEDRTYALLAGTFVFDHFSCKDKGLTGLIVENEIEIRPGPGDVTIDCDEVIFRGNGTITTYANLKVIAGEISGPVTILGKVADPTLGDDPKSPPASLLPPRKSADGAAGEYQPPFPFLVGFKASETNGRDGRGGRAGRNGRFGGSGLPGDAGFVGPDVTVLIDRVRSDTTFRIVSTGSRGTSGLAGRDGWPGQAGGAGGAGGPGADASITYLPGSGGRGGDGGAGGDGGRGGGGGRGGDGGRGGNVQLVFSKRSFELIADIVIDARSDGGQGGVGGPGGSGAKGGLGGSAGRGGVGGRSASASAELWAGKSGRAGRDGHRGRNGDPGTAGIVGPRGNAWVGNEPFDQQKLIELLAK